MRVNILVRSPGFEVNGELGPGWAAMARLSQAPSISVADHGDATSRMRSRYLRRPPTEAASCTSRFPNVSRLSDDTADRARLQKQFRLQEVPRPRSGQERREHHRFSNCLDWILGRSSHWKKEPRNKIHIPRGRQPELPGSTLSLGLHSCLTISNDVPPKRQLYQSRR
jgi:hypothetical protein